MTLNPVEFFYEHAARHLARGSHPDARDAVSAVFNLGYPCAIPIEEYASKTLDQARRAPPSQRKRMFAQLARYRIADRMIAGDVGDATPAERDALRTLRDAARAKGPARQRPALRRPAPGSVVVAREGKHPFAIANVQWATPCVEQRWMHQDHLGALIRRLAENPCDEPFVVAVADRPRFQPGTLAFSARGRLALGFSERTEYVEVSRLRELAAFLGNARPERRTLAEFRRLCRARALTVDVRPIDDALMRMAAKWRLDVHELHDLLLSATELEIDALATRAGD